MKKLSALTVILAVIFTAKAQDFAFVPNTFFSTHITFTENNLSDFYSSFIIDHNRVVFIANNYKTYGFDKQTGATQWEFDADRKTNQLPFIYGNSVIVGNFANEKHNCVRLDLNTGTLIQTLSIEPLNTQPFLKDSIMYCTAVYDGDGGQIMAYDLKANHIIWKKFIAHGVDAQPYFMQNKIIANAEENNWFELNYKGQLMDSTCGERPDIFVPDIICIRKFRFLTHDDYEINEQFIEKQFGSNAGIKMKYGTDNTVVLGAEKLLVIGSKKKILKNIDIEKIITLPGTPDNEYLEILKVEKNMIWFFWKNSLAVYNFKKSKTIHQYNLSKWNVHQIMLDVNNVWLISENDGQLYGLNLEISQRDADDK